MIVAEDTLRGRRIEGEDHGAAPAWVCTGGHAERVQGKFLPFDSRCKLQVVEMHYHTLIVSIPVDKCTQRQHA